MDTRIALSGQVPDVVGAYQNALANRQALEMGQMKNALAAQEMADMQQARDFAASPEGVKQKQQQKALEVETAKRKFMQDNLASVIDQPSLDDFNMKVESIFGEQVPPQFRQFGPHILKIQENMGIVKAPGQGAADYSGNLIVGDDGGLYRFNKRTGNLESTGNRPGLKPTQNIDYISAAEEAKAKAAAAGKASGERSGELIELEARLPALYEVAYKLSDLGKKATYTTAGKTRDAVSRQLGFEPGEGAVARQSYISTVDNEVLPLLRSTFGAAFTVEEGNRLRATLGNEDLSPQEKDAALKAFIESKEREVKTMKSIQDAKSGNTAPARKKFNPATGRLE